LENRRSDVEARAVHRHFDLFRQRLEQLRNGAVVLKIAR